MMAISLALFLGACADQSATAPSQRLRTAPTPGPSFSRGPGSRPDHFLIELSGAESKTLAPAIAALGGSIEKRLPDVNLVVARGLSQAAAESLSTRSDVVQVTGDMRIQWIPRSAGHRMSAPQHAPPPLPGVDQSTAFFFSSFQWNMRVTQANKAWLTTPEGKSADVYVLDTGIDPNHSDLAGLVDLDKSVSFSETEPGDILDHESHGTFVSAIVTSNGIGVASVAPLARLVAVKVLDSTGSGSFADLISGIVYAANQGADVINMSLGAVVNLSDPATRAAVRHLQAAILFARIKGSVIVAAAGNDTLNLATLPPQIMSVPAELLGVISVGATAPVAQMNFDQIASYSDFGFRPPNNGVQIFAPGGDLVAGGLINDLIISACSEFASFGCGPNDYLIGAGTSFASPMVSGEAAVLRSIVGRSRPGPIFNSACILAGTDNIGPSSIFGRGRMNVVKAAACAGAKD